MSTETPSHPFPEVAQWWDEKLAAEKDFREVLEKIEVSTYEYTTQQLAREVLAKHPKES